ncbi:dihydrofolate reductase [Kurthia sibirica]|uniref:Dihydrofolate reductase n=1 Tax=Kurthia sibirica TaxID=202750 RepID=A0A2U3APA9_9BACL|nr:dihydrofolate reductase [Kurthia sibirica]PWI26390.1 dihydrofolate reductase [Kurthia sibirica]GEK34173.1 dihydrofolate reductase [Kurthia sibirica]
MISLIVAHDKNRVIGLNNQMPWHLPGDLAYFKRMTMGKPIIMGRNTFESIGRPLPGRKNIIITRNKNYEAQGASVVHSLTEAIDLAQNEHDEIMIIGGQQIFTEALPLADRLYVTLIDHEFEGDTYFPAYENWSEKTTTENQNGDGFTFRYTVLEK